MLSAVMGLSPRFWFARDFGPEDHLLRNYALDKMVRIGDNGPVHILSWFSGSKSRDAF